MDDRARYAASHEHKPKGSPLEKIVVIPDGMPLIDLTTGQSAWVRDHVDTVRNKLPDDAILIIPIELPFDMLLGIEDTGQWESNTQQSVKSVIIHSTTQREEVFTSDVSDGLAVHILAADACRSLMSSRNPTVELLWAVLIGSLIGTPYNGLMKGKDRSSSATVTPSISALEVWHTVDDGFQLEASTLDKVLQASRH